MTIRSDSRLERLLHDGAFVVTAEVVPPRGADRDAVLAQARDLAAYADAVNVTDNPASSAHMSSVAGAALVASVGVEPVLQVTTRDRNRLAVTSDLLGAWALGARNVLCLTGDPAGTGDHPNATEVYDLDVLELIAFVARLRDRGTLLSGAAVDPAPRYCIGVADVPLADPYDPGRLEAKLDAGADFVQTQIVYDVEAMAGWAERMRPRGVFERMFVLAGVGILRSPRAARFVAEHLPGVTVPGEVIRRLEDAGEGAEAEGVRIAVEIVRELRDIDGVRGVHLMGMGREALVRRVIEDAALLPRPEPS